MTDAVSLPLISVVIPVYNEAENLPDLVARVGEALSRTGKTFELICIDDGSRDDSAHILAELAQATPWLQPRFLIRNYGQTAALQAGFDIARGQYSSPWTAICRMTRTIFRA